MVADLSAVPPAVPVGCLGMILLGNSRFCVGISAASCNKSGVESFLEPGFPMAGTPRTRKDADETDRAFDSGSGALDGGVRACHAVGPAQPNDRPAGFREAGRVGHPAVGTLHGRGFPAPRLSRHDRHPAHPVGVPPVSRFPGAGQARPADRGAFRAQGVFRLLEHEMVRPAAGEVGVSQQALAQRRAGLLPLAAHGHSRKHALRRVCPRPAHLQRQQLPRGSRQLLPRRAAARGRRPRPGGGAHLHGDAHRGVGPRPPDGDGRLFRAGGLQAHLRVEGGDCLLRPLQAVCRSRDPKARRPPLPRRHRGAPETGAGSPRGLRRLAGG